MGCGVIGIIRVIVDELVIGKFIVAVHRGGFPIVAVHRLCPSSLSQKKKKEESRVVRSDQFRERKREVEELILFSPSPSSVTATPAFAPLRSNPLPRNKLQQIRPSPDRRFVRHRSSSISFSFRCRRLLHQIRRLLLRRSMRVMVDGGGWSRW